MLRMLVLGLLLTGLCCFVTARHEEEPSRRRVYSVRSAPIHQLRRASSVTKDVFSVREEETDMIVSRLTGDASLVAPPTKKPSLPHMKKPDGKGRGESDIHPTTCSSSHSRL